MRIRNVIFCVEFDKRISDKEKIQKHIQHIAQISTCISKKSVKKDNLAYHYGRDSDTKVSIIIIIIIPCVVCKLEKKIIVIRRYCLVC